jgi:hypothetical protein
MHTKEAIRYVLTSARAITNTYLSDLSNEELLFQPHPNAHSIAWQLGHLIISEISMVNGIKHGYANPLAPEFIEAFSSKHPPTAPKSELAPTLLDKTTYTILRDKQRELTFTLLDALEESELSTPGPDKMRSYAPTAGCILLAIGTHEIMHAGQWAVVRRALNKKVLI